MDARIGAVKQRRALRRTGRASIAMVLATAGLVGGTYLWQHTQVDEQQVALDRAVSAGDAARTRASALEPQVRQLRGAVAALQRRADALRVRLQEVGKGKQHVAALLRASDHSLNRTEARMTSLLGSPLADGRYFGAMVLVGATQAPPRLVIDLEQWLTGAEADRAAKQDGALPPGEIHVPNDSYIRNENPQWRILALDPATKVSLTTYPFGQIDAPLVVTLSHFDTLYSAGKGLLSEFPYWITVRDGKVVAIEEQYQP